MENYGVNNLSLAKLIDSSHTSVGRWLKGSKVDMETTLKLAQALNVNVQWLLSGEGEMETSAQKELDRIVQAQLTGGPGGAAAAMADTQLIEAISEWWEDAKSEEKRWKRAAILETLVALVRELHRRDLGRKELPKTGKGKYSAKMKTLFFLLFIPLVAMAQEPSATPHDITLRNGEVLKSAIITKTTPIDVSIAHEEGVKRVPLEDMPPDYVKKLGYTEADAEAWEEKKAEEIAARQKSARIEALAEAELNNSRNGFGKIIQITEGGAIVDLVTVADNYYALLAEEDRKYRESQYRYKADPERFQYPAGTVFVVGDFSGEADGESVGGRFLKDGTFSFTTVMGASRTIPKYRRIATPATKPKTTVILGIGSPPIKGN